VKTSRVVTNTVAFVLFAAFCVLGILFTAVNLGLQVPLPGQQAFIVKADFKSAEGLVQYADVDIAGIKVGNVMSQAPAPDGGTLVTMKLDKPYQLRSDVRAVVRPKSLLGEQYVELIRTPGSTAPMLASGAVLPQKQTGDAVSIDDVLNNMDAPTRAAMSQSLQQLGVALDNNAQNVNNSIDPIDQTVRNLQPLAQTGTRRQRQLDQILTDLNTIMQSLADEQQQLGDIVDSGNSVMSTISARDQDLAGTVTQANTFFSSLDQIFGDLTPYDRQSLEESPATISATRQMLAVSSPEVARLFPELLLGQINYPNDQLEVTQTNALELAVEWMSAFSQVDQNGYSFRIVSIFGCESAEVQSYAQKDCNQKGGPLPAPAAAQPALPAPTTPGAAASDSGLDAPGALRFLLLGGGQ
jgi:phospholipid/cholesterol/gamma-HCH transport system substrate-binding protein